MATEASKVVEKKPPAHEVIVTLLQEYARTVQHEARDASHNPETAASFPDITQRASALCTVLMRMHIPEKDRSWVVDALKHLPPYFPPMGADISAIMVANLHVLWD